eukprot:6849492-Alexandrium_andersonii.AAC.1
MSGEPEVPPGLEPEVPRPKRVRAASVGAAPSASSAPFATSTSSAPTALGPAGEAPDAARASGRAPG